MMETTLFKPESLFARANAPTPGYACLQVKVTLPGPIPDVFHHQWLPPNEIHCAFDPRWMREHAQVVWKEIGERIIMNLKEINVVELCSTERREIEREIYSEEEEDTP